MRNGRTNDKQGKIGLLSLWMLEGWVLQWCGAIVGLTGIIITPLVLWRFKEFKTPLKPPLRNRWYHSKAPLRPHENTRNSQRLSFWKAEDSRNWNMFFGLPFESYDTEFYFPLTYHEFAFLFKESLLGLEQHPSRNPRPGPDQCNFPRFQLFND